MTSHSSTRQAVEARLTEMRRDMFRPALPMPGTPESVEMAKQMAEFYAIMLAPAHLYCQD